VDSRLYVSVDNRLLALNAKSGQKLWMQQVPWQKGSSSFLSLQTANGTVYATFLSYPGHQDVGSYSDAVHTSLIYAFAMSSGVRRWVSRPIDGEISPLVVDQQAIYLGSEAGHIYALNVTNGLLLWSYGYDPHASFVSLQKMEGVIYARQTLSLYGLAAAQYNGPPPSLGIVALVATSSKMEWRNTIPRTVAGTIGTPQGWDGGQLVAGNGIIYTSLRNGFVCSFTANHGLFLQCASIENSAHVSFAPTLTLVV
jgi:outer membrane protein assembly factor BamB